MRCSVIAFDFDGVIVDSNPIKRTAWFSIFNPETGVSSKLITQALERVRETRFDIVRYIFQQLGLTGPQLEQEVQTYAEKYNQAVQHGIAQIGVAPAVTARLERLAQKFPLYLNSATPEVALAQTVEKLGLKKYFAAALGRPATKVKNLALICAREHILPDQLLFVGDSASDARAAQEAGCLFVGIGPNCQLTQEHQFPVIADVTHLENVLKS